VLTAKVKRVAGFKARIEYRILAAAANGELMLKELFRWEEKK
jgi:hypothetical protein